MRETNVDDEARSRHMDIFTKFNRKNIQDRQIDTLIGLSKGILANGEVDLKEAEYLYTWLIQSALASDNPVIHNLLEKVDAMLADGVLDSEESTELLNILQKISGDPSAIGELSKSTSLPINNPPSTIVFKDKTFLFTGTCAFGTRNQCHDATKSLGGKIASNVTKSLDYLVIGTYVTDSWIHENYGRKIEKAMNYRADGEPINIITEEHWADAGNFL